jgi:hypothetical protein
MAYDATIPKPGDLLSQSQINLLANFAEINTFVSVNHEAFNSVAPHAQGKHKQIEMPVQAAAIATDPTQWSMYVKNNTLGVPAPALWLRPPVSAQHPAGAAIDITTATLANAGWCQLPCGLKLAWTNGVSPYNAAYALTAANIPGFPGFTAVYGAQVTQVSAGLLLYPIQISALSFNSITLRTNNGGGVTAYVFVIGI